MGNVGFTDEYLISSLEGLYKYALKLTNYNKHNAADLVQETAMKIILNRDKYKEGFAPLTWAYTVMRHLHIDRSRVEGRNRQKVVLIEDTVSESKYKNKELGNLYGVSKEKTVLNKIREQELKYTVDFFMKKLEQKNSLYANVMTLRYQGVLLKDIAEDLELPLNTVKAIIYRVRVLMRSTYNEIYMDLISEG